MTKIGNKEPLADMEVPLKIVITVVIVGFFIIMAIIGDK